MVKSGDRLFHVGSTGKVSNALATSDEAGGTCSVKLLPNGQALDARTFDLFNTEAAANRAAISRLPGSAVGAPSRIIR